MVKGDYAIDRGHGNAQAFADAFHGKVRHITKKILRRLQGRDKPAFLLRCFFKHRIQGA